MTKGGAIFHGQGSLSDAAMAHILNDHYLRRRPPMSHTFEWKNGNRVLAVATFGVPASRHMQKGACPTDPDIVLELNRLWVADDQPKNTASWFLSRVLADMPPSIILSYADTLAGHNGTVYRAANFFYAGWTDMERRTARFDYLPLDGTHTRNAYRTGDGAASKKVRRKPKAKYWTVTGNKSEKRRLMGLCAWPRLCWKGDPVPTEHKQRLVTAGEAE